MWKLIGFSLLSLPILFISLAGLRRPGSHGFHRFFAWEAILGLFVLNVDAWFRDPLALHQLLSWVLLFASLVPLAYGVHTLRTYGHQAQTRADDNGLFAFEKTTQLITTGIYRHIRHPLYSSLLLLGWGIFFKQLTWFSAILVLLATLFLFLTAQADERECIQFFGAPYQEYIKRTKRFIPFLF